MGAKALRLDPAVIASPAITTIVDATGLLIYLNLARSILGLG
jgi:magnesium transporter